MVHSISFKTDPEVPIPLWYNEKKPLLFLSGQHHFDVQAISYLQHIHQILYAQFIGKTQDDGRIVQSGSPCCQLGFDVIKRDLPVIDEVLFIFALGNRTLITLGLAKVETIRKKSRRKNMMSFREDVATSGVNCFDRLIFML
jgi:hypothetical protein